jgi:uncharacterized protein YggE
MTRIMRISLSVMTAAALAGAVSLMSAGASLSARAGEATMPPRTITVSGDAEIASRPDQARLSAGVVTQAETAAAALEANTTAMNRVFTTLKAAGIPENRIQTSNFSVQPQYAPFRPENPQPQRIIGYQVSNNVSVVVDDLTKVGATLDALVRSGANQLGGIQFMVADPKPLAERARSLAVVDATAKARTLATAAGVTLGPLMSIQETSSVRPIPVFAMARAQVAEAVPIAEGEERVRVDVTMTYAIQ